MPQKWSLSSLNARWSDRKFRATTLSGIFLASLLVLIAPVAWRGELNAPPGHGDGPEYESIALGLHQGRGYASVMDQEYLKPYAESADQARYTRILERSWQAGTTAARPPLLPLVMAGTYRIFGRQFWSIRILNCVAMAVSCVIFAGILLRQFGFFPTLIFVFLFLVADYRIREMAAAVMTESFSVLLMACLFLSLIKLAQTGSSRASFLAGVMLGLSILNRSVFVTWLPGMLLLVAYLTAGAWRQVVSRQSVRNCLLFVCAALLIPMPWFIRNCVVLESFMPTGTQGPVALASGFSDWAIKNYGVWRDIPAEEPAYQQARTMTGLQREKFMAQTASAETKRWVRENLEKIPKLTLIKVCKLWLPLRRWQTVLYLAMLFGTWIWIRWPAGKIFAGLAVLLTFQIAVTYTHFGRFQIPMLGMTLSAAAIGFWAILLIITEYRNPLRNLVSLENGTERGTASQLS